MITHENLVQAVYRSNDAWSCPDGDENCLTDYDCMECTERLVKEYENALRAESLAEALKPYDAESVEDLVRNVRKKTIMEVYENINKIPHCTKVCMALVSGNISCDKCGRQKISMEDVDIVIEQMKEGGKDG